MLFTKSINAAAYLSTVTGVVADIVKGYDGVNTFRFRKTAETMTSYNDYRQAVDNDGELQVDLIEFNKYIRKYRREIRKR